MIGSATESSTERFHQFGAAVRRGLTAVPQKFLDSRYLYDAVGTALFEVITLLPEYGVTRADERIMERHAPELADHMGPDSHVVELGSGTGVKTRRILSALSQIGPVTYRPIDVSGSALARCSQEVQDISGVDVEPLQHSYVDGLKHAMDEVSEARRTLLLFLGGTIGNFDRDAIKPFLTQVRAILRRGDSFLLGADLEKPIPELLAAYDDPIGVTAAFNLNLLARINRELNADIEIDQFEHIVRYDEAERRIEMHLRSRHDQKAHIRAIDLDLTIREEETIWTESSHKFNPEEISHWAAEAGFTCATQWIDHAWPFAESLLVAE